jgi:outer membrane protein OmpA-like peptidoglycan-associated protein
MVAMLIVAGSLVVAFASVPSGAVTPNVATDIATPNTTGIFNAVTCVDATDCTAVGQDQGASPEVPFVAVETAGTWTSQDLAPSPTSLGGELQAVSCVSATDCTAVGYDPQVSPSPLIVETESAGSWTEQDLVGPGGDGGNLLGISCSSATDCTAVGVDTTNQDPLWASESSGVWTTYDVGGQGTLFAVSCVDASDCTAVGPDQDGSGQPAYVTTTSSSVLNSLSLQDTPGLGYHHHGTFFGVSCSDATDCTAVGFDASDIPFYDQEVAGSWGASEADTGEPSGAQGQLNSISCADANDCTAVGQDMGSSTGFYVTESGGVWSTPGSDLVTSGIYNNLLGVSCVDAYDCTTVGDDIAVTEPVYDYLSLATTVTDSAIAGITPPVSGATPVTSITADAQFTGTVTWNGNPSSFSPATAYTATITLTPTAGYSLAGVAANFFTVSGATSVTNTAGSNVVTAVFPATAGSPSNGSPAPTPPPTPPTTTTTMPPTTTTTMPVAPPAPPKPLRHLRETLEFATGSSVLNATDQLALVRFAATVDASASARLVVTGYASPVGPVTINEQLSWSRAQSVASFLRAKLAQFAERHVTFVVVAGGVKNTGQNARDQVAWVTN